jgi:hypothetical protein
MALGFCERRAAVRQWMSIALSWSFALATATAAAAHAVGGPPKFANPVEYDATVTGAQYVDVGDVLHRGINDLIVTHANYGYGYVSMLRGTGRGTFGMPQIIFKGNGGDIVNQAHIADVTGTGKLDLVMATSNAGGQAFITVALGDGKGHFTRASQTPVYSGPIVIGKFGPDTRDDVFVQAAYALPAMLLLSNGKGGFQVNRVSQGGGEGGLIAVPGKAGRVDLIGIGQSPNLNLLEQLQTLVGIGKPPYLKNPIYSPPSLLETIITGINSGISAAAGDLRGEGNNDLLVFGADFQWGFSVAATVYLGRHNGTFDPPLLVPINATRAFGSAAAIADFNGDGIPDIFMTTGGGNTYALRGIGDGTFPLALQSSLSFDPLYPHIAVANLKGGRLPDLVVSDQLGGNGVWAILNETPTSR